MCPFGRDERNAFIGKLWTTLNLHYVTKPYSHHIFLFPFQWDFKSSNAPLKDIPFDERTNLDSIERLMEYQTLSTCNKAVEIHKRWKRSVFKVDSPEDYNQYVYFYPYVRAILFDSNPDEEDKVLLQYEYDLGEEAKFEFIFKEKERDKDGTVVSVNETPVSLCITAITLNYYFTGIGILAFHLDNNEEQHAKFESVLKINEFGRRIFPQYLTQADVAQKNYVWTDAVKSSFLSSSVRIKNKDGVLTETENFSYYNNLQDYDEFRLPHFIQQLLGCRFKTKSEDLQKNDVKIMGFGDDRMFTLCWLADDSLSNKLKRAYKSSGESLPLPSHYQYQVDSRWYSYLFVDGKVGDGVANEIFMQKQLDKHTYARWAEQGTFYGLTDYSFVTLVSEGYFGAAILGHVKTVYFRLVSLCLLQRFSVLRFASEAPRLSSFKKDAISQDTHLVEALQEKYVMFINKVYFREVTPQLQGAEMYEQMVDILKVERDVKDLNREIDELFQSYNFKSNKIVDDKLRLLAIVATVFAIPSFLVGFLGMNVFPEGSFQLFSNNSWRRFGVLSLAFLVVIIFSCCSYWLIERPKKKRLLPWICLIAGLLLTLLLLLLPSISNLFHSL